MYLSDGEPSEVIDPAVHGTRTVLASALLHRARVRRVFITSSAAALTAGNDVDLEGHTSNTIDESSWNDFSVQRCEEKGKDAEPMHKYRASKVLAERAAWDFYENAKKELGEKGETLGWDLVVFNPPFVFGPVVHECPSVETLGSSPAEFYKRIVKGEASGEVAQLTKFGYVARGRSNGYGTNTRVLRAGSGSWTCATSRAHSCSGWRRRKLAASDSLLAASAQPGRISVSTFLAVVRSGDNGDDT